RPGGRRGVLRGGSAGAGGEPRRRAGVLPAAARPAAVAGRAADARATRVDVRGRGRDRASPRLGQAALRDPAPARRRHGHHRGPRDHPGRTAGLQTSHRTRSTTAVSATTPTDAAAAAAPVDRSAHHWTSTATTAANACPAIVAASGPGTPR